MVGRRSCGGRCSWSKGPAFWRGPWEQRGLVNGSDVPEEEPGKGRITEGPEGLSLGILAGVGGAAINRSTRARRAWHGGETHLTFSLGSWVLGVGAQGRARIGMVSLQRDSYQNR